jgi:hypothetical protein
MEGFIFGFICDVYLQHWLKDPNNLELLRMHMYTFNNSKFNSSLSCISIMYFF